MSGAARSESRAARNRLRQPRLRRALETEHAGDRMIIRILSAALAALHGFGAAAALAEDAALQAAPAGAQVCVYSLFGICPVEIFQSFAWYQQIPVAVIVLLIFARAVKFFAAFLMGKGA